MEPQAKKKAILVIGKTCDEKNGFIRMLATPEKQNEGEGENQMVIKTNQCQSYQMDPAKNKYFELKTQPKDMFIIDTPNFQVEEQSDSVAKAINDFITYHQFEIICILYSFVGPSETFSTNQDPLYLTLHEKLTISNGIKDKSSYYLFPTLDSQCPKKIEEEIQTIQQKSCQLKLPFHKVIIWEYEDQKFYQKRIQEKKSCKMGNNSKQWRMLRKLLQQGEELWKKKKAILVVGKMGNGKSSFVRMLTTKGKAQQVKVGSSITNQTKQCQSYPIDKSKIQKFGLKTDHEDLYLIDTPGLDSQEQAYLIEAMIDDFILYNRFEIISILYVFNPNGSVRIFNENKQSFYHNLHKKLVIPKQIKDKVSHYVFTDFDNFYRKKQTYQDIVKELEQKGQKINVPYWPEIPWVSEPMKDKETYQELLVGKADPKLQIYFDNQEQLLGQFFKEGEEVSENFSFRDIDCLQDQLKKLELKKIKTFISNTDPKCEQGLTWVSVNCIVRNKCSIFKSRQSQHITWLSKFIQTLKSYLSNKYDTNVKQKYKSLNEERLIQKVKKYYLQELQSPKIIKTSQSLINIGKRFHLMIQKTEWLNKVEIKGLSATENASQWVFEISKEGNYEVECQVKIPSFAELKKIEDESKLEIYYQE